LNWCREKASLSPKAKHHSEVRLKEAETTGCDVTNQRLSRLMASDLNKNIYFSTNQVSDTKPLQSLTKLTALRFSGILLRSLALSSQSLSVSGNGVIKS